MSSESSHNIFDILQERGFIYQFTLEGDENIDNFKQIFDKPITCYIGFDPTFKSLHVGSMVPLMVLAYMQKYGHRPIALMGGGTGLIGDPSGKTEARKLLDKIYLAQNIDNIRRQFSRFLDFNTNALILNNAEWLTKLKYIDFLRDIGRHFSVNRMLASESIKTGLERGLSFIEFNYMLLQAYDFWYLFKNYDCILQMGGRDQWGNIVAGIELIRRKEGKRAYGLTFPLIETAGGVKMGKTEGGAIWLDSDLTSPYEFYQYWVNVDDRDVFRFLSLFTFLPMSEIKIVKTLEGEELNPAKIILAYEVTKIVHGEEKAKNALFASGVFGKKELPHDLIPSSSIPRKVQTVMWDSLPTKFISKDRLQQGIKAYELFVEAELCSSRSEARRLISQGGAYLNNERITDFNLLIMEENFTEEGLLLRKGKKSYCRILIK